MHNPSQMPQATRRATLVQITWMSDFLGEILTISTLIWFMIEPLINRRPVGRVNQIPPALTPVYYFAGVENDLGVVGVLHQLIAIRDVVIGRANLGIAGDRKELVVAVVGLATVEVHGDFAHIGSFAQVGSTVTAVDPNPDGNVIAHMPAQISNNQAERPGSWPRGRRA